LDLSYEILLNVAVYGALGAGVFAWLRQPRLPNPRSSEEAFAMLEKSLRHAFPDLKDGFTWREALSRLKDLKPDLGWESIDVDRKAYEEYKYGRGPPPGKVGVEFLKLVRFLKGKRQQR
jgi:hypothetical protein